MPRDVLPLRPAARTPDPGFAALAGLRRLRHTLPAAARFRDACRDAQRRADRWAEPPLFFVRDEHVPAERSAVERFGVAVARRLPAAAAAWAELREQASEWSIQAAESVVVRRAARAVPSLGPMLADLAPDHAGCRRLADLLAVADDAVLNVVLPADRRGWRVVVSGAADIDAVQALLLDAFTTDPPTVARWQAFRPNCVRPDGSLPAGPRGAAGWVWGYQPLAELPHADGMPLLVLGPAAYPRPLPPAERVAGLRPTLDVLEMIAPIQVSALCGTAPPAADRKAA